MEYYGGSVSGCAKLLDKMKLCDSKLRYEELMKFRWTNVRSIAKVGNFRPMPENKLKACLKSS